MLRFRIKMCVHSVAVVVCCLCGRAERHQARRLSMPGRLTTVKDKVQIDAHIGNSPVVEVALKVPGVPTCGRSGLCELGRDVRASRLLICALRPLCCAVLSVGTRFLCAAGEQGTRRRAERHGYPNQGESAAGGFQVSSRGAVMIAVAHACDSCCTSPRSHFVRKCK